MYVQIILLPFFGFLCATLLGRYLGHKGIAYVTCVFMIIGNFIAILIFYEVSILNNFCYLELFDWISIPGLRLKWALYFDFLSSGMLLTVYLISTLVHIYSVEYMAGDPHFPRFMGYLSFFTFFMILLITAGNVLQLFVGWEGVGLCSYLLVSFWFTRTQAVLSSLKAFLINRVGDVFFIVALGLLYVLTKTFDYSSIFILLKNQEESLMFLLNPTYSKFTIPHIVELPVYGKTSILNIIALCLFIGAMSKSAQIFLHTWLPDAMEGPTPVSALIHAATMVAAGVFLVLRFSFLFDMVPSVLQIIALIGSLTCFTAATIGLFQNDIKKIIAYSTCSQLGYMFFIVGLSFYNISFFHLCSHAFFKALLFLCAGSVIHSLKDSQDIRMMGSLINKTPITCICFIAGSLALSGLPFLSGFYSKEAILEFSSESFYTWALFSKIMGLFAAVFTAMYSYKLLHAVFFSQVKANFSSIEKSHESGSIIIGVLLVLSLFSITFGFWFRDFFIGYGNISWNGSLTSRFIGSSYFDSEIIPFFFKILPLTLTLLGIYLAQITFLFLKKTFFFQKYWIIFFSFFSKKWHFDSIYNYFLVNFFSFYGYKIAYKIVDKGILELLGPWGLENLLNFFTKIILKIQTGYVYHYIVYTVLAIFIIPLISYFTLNLLPEFFLILFLVFLSYYKHETKSLTIHYIFYTVYLTILIYFIF